MKNIKIIRNLVTDGLFLALILLFTFVPFLGYIQIVPGTITITTMHLLVLLGASLFGIKKGTLYGLFFGLSSLIKASTMGASPIDFIYINPFISVLPRVLFGLISGLIFDLIKKKLSFKKYMVILPFCAFILTMIHTILTVGSLYIFGILDIFKISYALGLETFIQNIIDSGFIYLFGSAVLFGMLGESIVSFILIPILHIGLRHIKFIKEIDDNKFLKVVKSQ